MKRFLLPLVLFLVLVGFLAVGLHRDPKEVPSPLIGKPAPAFTLPTLHDPDQRIRNPDLLGKVWMLNVWASWCGACREEHPVLMAFARRNLVPIYGLDYKDERSAGLAWLQAGGNPYVASLFDQDGRVGIDFGVYGVPETFIIDQGGVIRYKHIGPLTPDVLSKEVEPLLRRLNG
jgi:cytochrome c biogenesis protein CcmG/thiol:disulfide interchange protein DsbE